MRTKEMIRAEMSKLQEELNIIKKQELEEFKKQILTCPRCKTGNHLEDYTEVVSWEWDNCEDFDRSEEVGLICPSCQSWIRLLSEESLKKYYKQYENIFKNPKIKRVEHFGNERFKNEKGEILNIQTWPIINL